MRVIVTGSRGWSDRYFIAGVLAELPGGTTIVHGSAKGADKLAAQEAQKLGLLLEPHPAEWALHDREGLTCLPCSCSEAAPHCKFAGFRRNEHMASLGADLCIAFWDGRSSGTADMMERAAKHGIPVEPVHRDFPNRERRRLRECVAAAS
jgi:hypothetical protein